MAGAILRGWCRENLQFGRRAGRRARNGVEHFLLRGVCRLFPVVEERIDRPTELLSGGQQQMVAIVRALLLLPDLLIMDDPSTGAWGTGPGYEEGRWNRDDRSYQRPL